MFGIKKLKDRVNTLEIEVVALRCGFDALKARVETVRDGAIEDFDLLVGALSLKQDKPVEKKPVKKANVKK